jgi:hypothetical protein
MATSTSLRFEISFHLFCCGARDELLWLLFDFPPTAAMEQTRFGYFTAQFFSDLISALRVDSYFHPFLSALVAGYLQHVRSCVHLP